MQHVVKAAVNCTVNPFVSTVILLLVISAHIVKVAWLARTAEGMKMVILTDSARKEPEQLTPTRLSLVSRPTSPT
jgi:hypothetical protein